MPKREFLMLAHKYDPDKSYIGGWYASEKLDGMRCFWDGGITRDLPKADVPWANTDKDNRYVDEQISTGLWTRYGNVIHAPKWWLDQLPNTLLDGELYIPEFRQDLMKIVKDLVPSVGWSKVQFHVFDVPSPNTVFQSGYIKNPNAKQYWTSHAIESFLNHKKLEYSSVDTTPFMTKVKIMPRVIEENNVVVIHPQTLLPSTNGTARVVVDEMLESIVAKGGEGLMLRAPMSKWETIRSKTLLKVKPYDDMEVKVVGYITGKGKHHGRLGSLIVESSKGRFAVGGLTDDERAFATGLAKGYARRYPGERLPEDINQDASNEFKLGEIITIKYRGYTKDGIPQEARYHRKRNDD